MMDEIASKYGHQASGISEILISENEIQARVSALGQEISRDYTGQNLIVVGVLKGVLFFMADLLRAISIPIEVDFMAVSSYNNEARQQGYVRLIKDLEASITERDVLFVEDVIDTGLTLNYLLRNLRARNPASLEVCTLFNKPHNRLIEIPIRYKGFDIPDRFVVGYGLDYQEKYRNLPFLGLLKMQVMHTRSDND